VLSMLMLEAAANICIECLKLENTVFREIDRLPILAKFDYYLRCSFRNRKLERGCGEVQAARELKALRDAVVHLKPHKVKWEFQGGDGTTEPELTSFLRIPKNPDFWHNTHALTTVRAVHSFLQFFFCTKCKYTATKTTSILFAEAEIPGEQIVFPMVTAQTKLRLRELEVPLRYLRFV
ncbi:MAG TPA: hypothetical protein VE969_10510, partial [Pyrinomonadaceae bacterium]|nr:hypothetical protein [Pyrinomonadaceae bacterium]